MKRLVTGIILTSAFTLAIPLAAPGQAHAAGAGQPVVANKASAAPAKPAAVKPAAPPVQLLDGANENPRWIDAERLLITRSTEEGKADYLIHVKTKKFEPVLTGAEGAELLPSPDGKTAVFLNEAGEVYSVDLATRQVSKVSDDKSIKYELQWSRDGKKLYFLQGDKTNVIAELTLADGKVNKLVEDKVDYKSDLRVSGDGTKFYYLVTKGGKLTADSVKENDEKSVEEAKVELDLSGTEPQLYLFDTKAAEPKAVQLTSSKENKISLHLLADGRVAYVGADPEQPNQAPALKVVSADGKETKNLVADANVLEAALAVDGRLFILAADASGKKAIYEVDTASGKRKKTADVAANTAQFFISADGKQIAVAVSTEQGDKFAVLNGSTFEEVTK